MDEEKKCIFKRWKCNPLQGLEHQNTSNLYKKTTLKTKVPSNKTIIVKLFQEVIRLMRSFLILLKGTLKTCKLKFLQNKNINKLNIYEQFNFRLNVNYLAETY